MESESPKIVERIQLLCDKNKTNINALEKAVGLGKSTIRFWNEHLPSIDKVAKVAQYFNVSTDYIYGLTENLCTLNNMNECLLRKLHLSQDEIVWILETIPKIRNLYKK